MFKIAISYPPLKNIKGIPAIGQNRQYQELSSHWNAYPIVLASAATLLKSNGYKVFWDDAIAEGIDFETWEKRIIEQRPDLVVIETKTPVVKHHWQLINDLKQKSAQIGWNLKIVLVGDHVSALPEESLKHSNVDYVLMGGDYDFSLLNLVNYLNQKETLKHGWYFHDSNGEIKNTGNFILNHNLDELPFIDRDLSQWKLYAFKNSNYCSLPGTYTMFARDCWWGKCSFCSWVHNLYPIESYRVMSVERALNEIGHIIEHYPIKEIMDDSGTFPTGDWLRQFCKGMIERGYNKRVRINCNMRFNNDLLEQDYKLMAQAGFRFLLFGLESVNKKTLDRLNKNLKVEDIETTLSWAKRAGLYPHLTIMIGYPWETKIDIEKTLEFVKKIFKKNLADSLQATMVMPYPGTPLFKEAKENGWLKTLDWNSYSMKNPVLETGISDIEIKQLTRSFYKAMLSPQFIFEKLKESFFDFDIFRYYCRLALKFFSKLWDFFRT